MELHKNWHVSKEGLKQLHALSESKLKEAIADKNLFKGLPTKYAEKQNAIIYGKINNSRAKKKVRKTNVTKNKKGNGAYSKK